jgi:hypothetical protein
MSPRQALCRFERLMQKCGVDKVAKDNRFQQERELRCAALFLMGIGKVNHERYWLRPGEDIYRDVDIQVVRYDKSQTGAYARCEFHIQITEFESHSNDFVAVIQKKMNRTPLRANLDLLVNIRDKAGQQFYPQAMANQMKKLNPGFRTIWFVVDDARDDRKYHVVKVWPEMQRLEYNVKEELARQAPPDWLRLKRGTREELEGTAEEPDLRLPDCD